MSDITSASAVAIITVPDVFGTIQLQGWNVDEAFDSEEVETAEAVIGVDGEMTGAWIPRIVPITFHFMADSRTVALFEAWMGAQDAAEQIFYASSGSIELRSIGKVYNMTKGILTKVKMFPDAKKRLDKVPFTIKWGKVTMSALG